MWHVVWRYHEHNRTHKHTITRRVQTVKFLNMTFSLYSCCSGLTFSMPLSTLLPNTPPINALPYERPRKNCSFTLTVLVFISCFQWPISPPYPFKSYAHGLRSFAFLAQDTGYYKPPPSKNRKRVGEPQQRMADFALSQDKNSIVIRQDSWKLTAIRIQILQTLINVQYNDGTGKLRHSSPYSQHYENM